MCRFVNHICVRARLFRFFGSCATFVFRAPIFIVQCHTILHDHPCWYFNRSTYRSILLSRSHVFTNAVHLNTIHRFAGTVRGRGGSHMVDRVASNDSQLFDPMRCRDALCVVPASIVRVVCFSSLCLSECRAWPT